MEMPGQLSPADSRSSSKHFFLAAFLFRARQIGGRPKLLLALIVLIVFWHAPWAGAPRTDQINYLHQQGQYTTLSAILSAAPSFHRENSAGDFILYRPLLFLFLGLQYYLYGYHFALWQITGMLLHFGAVFLLYSIACKTSLNPTWGFLLSSLFASSFLGSELVIWNHLTGYILFAVCALASLRYLLQYLEGGPDRLFYMSWTLAFAATFIYELGVVYCVLAAVAFVRRKGRFGSRRCIALFLSIPVVYITANLGDYYRVFHRMPVLESGTGVPHGGLLVLGWLVLKQLAFWGGGLLVPAFYVVLAQGRATFLKYTFAPTPMVVLNILALPGIVGGGVVLLKRFGAEVRWDRATRAGLCLAFAFANSVVIAGGRSSARGLAHTLSINIYYAYLPMLACIVAICLLFWSANPVQKRVPDRVSPSKDLRGAAAATLAVSIFLVSICNGVKAFELVRAYRFGYSAIHLRLLGRLSEWREAHAARENAFYRVSADCAGNDPLPWFGIHIRRGAVWTGPFTYAEALYPVRSYDLNQAWLRDAHVEVSMVSCSSATAAGIRQALASSSNGDVYSKEHLVDGTPAAWGSSEANEDTYAGVELLKPAGAEKVEITLFTPAGRPHLHDIRVVTADRIGPQGPAWHVVRARLGGTGAGFGERVTVPPGEDGSMVEIEVDRHDPQWRAHRFWGIECFSKSRGDIRNYLGVGGNGIYIRELSFR
jgi:hypothetical protein